MFDVVEPNYYSSKQSLLNIYLNMLTKNKNLFQLFHDHKFGTFIIMNDEAKGIFGGALLVKKSALTLQQKIRDNLPTSETKNVWTCTVYLHLENENLFPDFEFFCKKFYKDLYQNLVEFGMRESVDYINVSLVPGEYLCTEVLGFWPYVMEIRPNESEDGLFHGILSLLKNRPKLNTSSWAATLSEDKRVAA